MIVLTVLVIDEDILGRQAVANILQKEPNLDIRVSGDLETAVEKVQSLNPDILLLNIHTPDNSGVSVLRALNARYPDLPIVVMTPRSREGARQALYALHHGAVDVITKPEQSSLLLFAGRHLVKRLRPS
ncbi:MAG: response regulator, partial [Balneolaceae bacterium]|nr:response regulator [Balneolaceae bacterium]